MLRCKILVSGRYSDYQGSGHNRKSAVHTEDDVVLFPFEYAVILEANSMIEILDGPEVIEIDEADLLEVKQPVRASESAIEAAANYRIDLASITGTGSEGRVVLADVKQALRDTDVGESA